MRCCFLLFSLIAIAALPQHALRAADAPASQPTTAPAVESFPTWGVSLKPPVGWVRTPPKDATVMASWTLPGAPDSSLTIFASPLERRSVRDMAERAAVAVEGVVKDTTLDARNAITITGGKRGAAALYAQRTGYLFQALCDPPPSDPTGQALEAVRTSWRWIDVDSPTKHPQPAPTPQVVYNRVQLTLPEVMRPFSDPRVDASTFAALDFSSPRLRIDFRMEITMPAGMDSKSIDDIKRDIGEELRQKYHILPQIEWQKFGDAIISQTVVDTDERTHGRIGMRKAVLPAADGKRLLFNFINTASTTADRQGYDGFAEQIIQSAKPVTPPATKPSAP